LYFLFHFTFGKFGELFVNASVVTSKPAIRGRVKTGQRISRLGR